jgi:hypothetical protein
MLSDEAAGAAAFFPFLTSDIEESATAGAGAGAGSEETPYLLLSARIWAAKLGTLFDTVFCVGVY